MTILDLHIWSVTEKNDWMINWAVEDTANMVKNSINAATNTLWNTASLLPENLTQTVRHPWQTIFNKWNWWKLLRTTPVVWIDIINKAKSLPFRTLDLWIQYIVNNNLERIVWTSKSLTTWVLANFITSNWETNWKVNKVLGSIIEWTWDLVWSIIKAPTWLIWLWANKLNKYVWNLWLEKTDEWVKNLRLSEKDFFNFSINNSWYSSNTFQDVNFWKINNKDV